MNRAFLRGLAVSAVSVLLMSALTGCWNPFAPDPGGNGPPVQPAEYRIRENPQDVIHNLKTAYVHMDADEYLDCLAEDFVFFLNPEDLLADPTLPEYWGKAGEEEIHVNMFGEGDPHVERIELVFTHEDDVWDDGDPGDPLDDLWTYREDIDLRVYLPEDLILWAEARAEFLFRVDPDEVGPGGEILWEIWNQWDLSVTEKRGGSGSSEDRTSLTQLKAMFRE